MVNRVMSQCRQLGISGVVAAGAGVVILPADFGAGRGFSVMVNRFMLKRLQLRIGGVVAAGAGIVILPADFGAGCSFTGMVDQVVVVWIYIAEIKGSALVIAIGADLEIHSRRYAGSCSLLICFE